MDFQRVLSAGSVSRVNTGRKALESGAGDSESLRKACQDFESVFITYLLKSMRKTVPKTEFTGGGPNKDMYLSMMDEEIAKAVARGPGIGLAASIYQQFNQNRNI